MSRRSRQQLLLAGAFLGLAAATALASLFSGPVLPHPARAALDAGAMSFFNGNCPEGWTEQTALAGRVPVGAGAYAETYTPDSRSWSFSHTYSSGETGGYATWQLNSSEMASHQHGSIRRTGGPSGVATPADISSPANRTTSTNSTGGDGAHGNRPPYLALRLCRKD